MCLCCLLNPLSREAHWPFFQNDVTLTVKSFNLLSPFLLSYSIRLEMLYKQHILLLLRFILMAVFLNFRLTLSLDHFLFCLCWSAPRRVVVSFTESHPFSSSSTIWHTVIHPSLCGSFLSSVYACVVKVLVRDCMKYRTFPGAFSIWNKNFLTRNLIIKQVRFGKNDTGSLFSGADWHGLFSLLLSAYYHKKPMLLHLYYCANVLSYPLFLFDKKNGK